MGGSSLAILLPKHPMTNVTMLTGATHKSVSVRGSRHLALGLRPLPYHFEHLFKTLDMALCLFAVCHERLRKLRHLGRLAIFGKSQKNPLFRAVNILQLRQNRSPVFSPPWESPSDM
jgi:hypothetical protein